MSHPLPSRRPGRSHFVSVLAALALLAPAGAGAGYEHIRAHAGVATDLADGRFQDLWRVSPLAVIGAESPSAAGLLGLSLWGGRAHARVSDLPDFWIGGLAASLVPETRPHRSLRLGPGVAFGMQTTHFDREGRRRAPSTESEYTVDVFLRVRVRLSARVDVHTELRRRHLLTHETIRQTHALAGLGYRFESPGWLRELLR